MRVIRLQEALERLTTAIHDVESELAAMKAEHDPLASHIFVSRRDYRNVNDTEKRKAPRDERPAEFQCCLRAWLSREPRRMGTPHGSSCEAVTDCSTPIAFSRNTGSTPGSSNTFRRPFSARLVLRISPLKTPGPASRLAVVLSSHVR